MDSVVINALYCMLRLPRLLSRVNIENDIKKWLTQVKIKCSTVKQIDGMELILSFHTLFLFFWNSIEKAFLRCEQNIS